MGWNEDYTAALEAQQKNRQAIADWQAGRQPYYQQLQRGYIEGGSASVLAQQHDALRQQAQQQAGRGTRYGSADMAGQGGISQAAQQQLGAVSLAARQRSQAAADYDSQMAYQMQLQNTQVGNPLYYGTNASEDQMALMARRQATDWGGGFMNTQWDAADARNQAQAEWDAQMFKSIGQNIKGGAQTWGSMGSTPATTQYQAAPAQPTSSYSPGVQVGWTPSTTY